jgi:hypothetical protein
MLQGRSSNDLSHSSILAGNRFIDSLPSLRSFLALGEPGGHHSGLRAISQPRDPDDFPIFPNKLTFSEPVGTSQKCNQETPEGGNSMPILAQLGSATIRPTRRTVIPPRGIVKTNANGP